MRVHFILLLAGAYHFFSFGSKQLQRPRQTVRNPQLPPRWWSASSSRDRHRRRTGLLHSTQSALFGRSRRQTLPESKSSLWGQMKRAEISIGLCALRRGIQNSMEAILACHRALFNDHCLAFCLTTRILILRVDEQAQKYQTNIKIGKNIRLLSM